MEGEFNNLNINNTDITFTKNTNNIQTSDELEASAIYQDKMGTNYSRAKKVSRGITIVGITIVAISTGGLLTNVYITNPPSVVDKTFSAEVSEHVFHYSFETKNPRKYKMMCYLNVNGENKLEFECTEETVYSGQCDGLEDGDAGKFYITFSNRVDYKRTIKNYTFIVGGEN